MLESTKIVVLGIVAARLDYCSLLLYGTSSDNLQKLHVTQTGLARVVCQAARTCSATELHRQLHWLPVKQRINYKLAVLTYKVRQSGSPSYLASLITDYVHGLRSSDKLLLSRPCTSFVMVDKAFSVCAPKIWNGLSFNCRAATTVNSFERNLKRELFYTAYADHSQ